MDNEKIKQLLHDQTDNEAYSAINQYLESIQDEDIESLVVHLRTQEDTLRFCGDKPPATLVKTIFLIRNLIEQKGGDPQKLLDQPENPQ
jgi:cobalamin biosynthesis protein CobT